MKKIALIADPWVGSMKRAEAFIKENSNKSFTIFKINSDGKDDLSLQHTPKGKYELKKIVDYDQNEFDLVLVMNDKHFHFVLEKYLPFAKNMVDKASLNESLKSFGDGFLKSSGFTPDDVVFVKPRVGAGQYATDELNYKPHKFKDLQVDMRGQVVQEFVDSPVVVSVTLVGNGKTLEFIDVTEAHHLVDNAGRSLNSFLKSVINEKSRYEKYISLAFAFTKFIDYDTIPGVFMLQFLTRPDGSICCNDFNVRTGPVSDYMTLLGFTHRIHRMIPFMLGDEPFNNVNFAHQRYQCYLEEKDQESPISDRVVRSVNPRYRLVEEKTSGIIRNDYDSFLEILDSVKDPV